MDSVFVHFPFVPVVTFSGAVCSTSARPPHHESVPRVRKKKQNIVPVFHLHGQRHRVPSDLHREEQGAALLRKQRRRRPKLEPSDGLDRERDWKNYQEVGHLRRGPGPRHSAGERTIDHPNLRLLYPLQLLLVPRSLHGVPTRPLCVQRRLGPNLANGQDASNTVMRVRNGGDHRPRGQESSLLQCSPHGGAQVPGPE